METLEDILLGVAVLAAGLFVIWWFATQKGKVD